MFLATEGFLGLGRMERHGGFFPLEILSAWASAISRGKQKPAGNTFREIRFRARRAVFEAWLVRPYQPHWMAAVDCGGACAAPQSPGPKEETAPVAATLSGGV